MCSNSVFCVRFLMLVCSGDYWGRCSVFSSVFVRFLAGVLEVGVFGMF